MQTKMNYYNSDLEAEALKQEIFSKIQGILMFPIIAEQLRKHRTIDFFIQCGNLYS